MVLLTFKTIFSYKSFFQLFPFFACCCLKTTTRRKQLMKILLFFEKNMVESKKNH